MQNQRLIQYFSKNVRGRDIIVGDIHGHFSRVKEQLRRLSFNCDRDRLFSVGDLIDRGPESDEALDWLAKDWFHAVKGNHEEFANNYRSMDLKQLDVWIKNGGIWFHGLTPAEQQETCLTLGALPYAIEIETNLGLVGVMHADCPVVDWARLPAVLGTAAGKDAAVWSRKRLSEQNKTSVQGVRAVVVGHNVVKEPTTLGNVIHIDTGGWLAEDFRFTFLNAATLKRL